MAFLADDEARLAVDEKILEHEKAIRALKTHRNTYNPTARLPSELLSQIFMHGKWQHQCNLQSYPPTERLWLNVSGVCRHWRDVALNTPRLWSTINLCDIGPAVEMLRRSKSSPLELRCTSTLALSKEPVRDLAKAALSNSQRILELDLLFNDPASLTTLLGFSSSPVAPILEILRLSMVFSQPRFTIPATVLWNDMPALHTLELRNMHIPCELPKLPCLTRLIIQPSTGAHATHVSWLIKILKSTPNIEEITVSRLSCEPPDDLTTSSRVFLPKLSLLRLTSMDLVGSSVFNWIDYPRSTRIDYDLISLSEAQSGGNFSNLHIACSRITTDTDAPLLHEIRIALKLDRLTIQVSSEESSTEPNFRLRLPQPKRTNVVNYTQLCAALPLSQAAALILDDFANSTPDLCWQTLFPSCTQLTSLTLHGCGSRLVEGLLKAPGEETPPVPELETIYMRECSFNVSPDERDDRMYSALLKVVDEHPKLEGLELRSCNIMRAVVEGIEAHIDVGWDEIEMEYPSDANSEYNMVDYDCYSYDDDDGGDDDGYGPDIYSFFPHFG